MTAAIKAMQEWLKTCPLVSQQLEDGVVFNIDYLPDCAPQFSIEDSPSDPIVTRYFSGSERVKNYVLASRMAYGPDVWLQAENSAFWDDFTAWIEDQSDAGNLPDLGPHRQVLQVAVTDSGCIITSEDGSCRFQIQIQVLYYQSKGAFAE